MQLRELLIVIAMPNCSTPVQVGENRQTGRTC